MANIPIVPQLNKIYGWGRKECTPSHFKTGAARADAEAQPQLRQQLAYLNRDPPSFEAAIESPPYDATQENLAKAGKPFELHYP